jgi:hypothetical protein
MVRTSRKGPLEGINPAASQSVGPAHVRMRLAKSLVIPVFLITCHDQAFAAALLPPALNNTACPELEPELLFWQTIMASHIRSDYEAYLRKYPDGQFAAVALC